MSSLNKVTIIGNVGNEPEIRSTNDGREIASFSVATTEKWKDKSTKEIRSKTEWHRVVIFSSGLVNVVKQYLHKGAKVYIEGSLQTRKWTAKDGGERYTTEIVLQGYGDALIMLDKVGAAGDSEYTSESVPQIVDEEIPF